MHLESPISGFTTFGEERLRQSIVLVFNPKSGKGKSEARMRELAVAVQARNIDPICLDANDSAIEELRKRHALRKLSAVVVCGGDGTLNSVLNCAPPDLPIAVFPCGTSNLMSRRIRMPCNPQAAARVLAARKVQKFDCGRVGERLFLLTLSAGFDAAITHCLEAQRHGPINRLSFVAPIYHSIREYDFPQLRITARRDGITPKSVGSTVEYVSRWCFIQNLPGYALLLNFTPRADGRDGLLDYCLFERPGFLNGLFFIYRVLLGRHRLLKDCHVGRSQSIHVECLDPSKTVSVQLDGEDAGTLPIDVEVVPNRATFIIP
ncbi:MAG: hypothetical protein K8U03_20760 [Planctomycetia bacterium]|nr:hypothetical protein [Planctomycetia bacterium]